MNTNAPAQAIGDDGDAQRQRQMQALYVLHHPWLVGLLQRKVRDRHQAEDFAHDTFERVIRSGNIAQIQQPRAYLSTLAQRVLYTHWRRRELEQAWLDALTHQPEEHAPSAEDYAMVRETIEALDRLLHGLGPRVRQAFLMNMLAGQSHAEIARELHISVTTVERDIRRALLHCWQARQTQDELP